MDIYTYLKKDHRSVAELMEAVVMSKSRMQRAQLFSLIKVELTLHADAEEATFYKAIESASRSKQVHEKMEHADKEHDEIRDYLDKLSTLPVGSDEWLEQFGEFKHAVDHHVEEEEKEIFEKAKKYLTKEKAAQLAKDMEMIKQQQKLMMSAA